MPNAHPFSSMFPALGTPRVGAQPAAGGSFSSKFPALPPSSQPGSLGRPSPQQLAAALPQPGEPFNFSQQNAGKTPEQWTEDQWLQTFMPDVWRQRQAKAPAPALPAPIQSLTGNSGG